MSGSVTGSYFDAGDWFGAGSLAGTSSGASSAFSHMSGSSSMDVSSYAESEGEADIPIFFPVPFQELSSLQFYTPAEQLLELTAALMRQFQRHCFIQIHQKEAQPMLVPFVPQRRPKSEKNRDWYKDKLLTENQALPAAEVDALIESREVALLKEVNTVSQPVIDITPEKPKAAVPAAGKRATEKKSDKASPWDQLVKDPIGRE